MKQFRTIIVALVSTISLALLPPSLWAHGGEDHGNEASLVPTASIAPRASAQTEDFELVVVLQGRKLITNLDIFASNVPVRGAQIEIESGNAIKFLAVEVMPGVYETVLAEDVMTKPGKYPLTFTIQAGDTNDLLEANLEIPAVAKVEAEHAAGWKKFLPWILAAGLALVIVLMGMTVRRIKNTGMANKGLLK